MHLPEFSSAAPKQLVHSDWLDPEHVKQLGWQAGNSIQCLFVTFVIQKYSCKIGLLETGMYNIIQR